MAHRRSELFRKSGDQTRAPDARRCDHCGRWPAPRLDGPSGRLCDQCYAWKVDGEVAADA